MAFYGISYGDVMELPIKTFWLMSSNINKITAENDIRRLNLLLTSQMGGTADGVTEHVERLRKEMGTPIKRTAVVDGSDLDKEGLAALKTMTL